MHRALTIGVSTFADPYAALGFAPGRVDELRAELASLGYACGEPWSADCTSQALGEAVRDAIRSAAADDVLIVHVLSHGDVGDTTGKLYVVGADGTRHDLADVEGWLTAVQDGPHPPLVLFVLDVCEAGLAARLPWQGRATDGTARAWVIAACAPHEQAFNGWLTQATTTVLRRLRAGEFDIDPGVEFVPLPKIAQEIRAEVRRLAQAEGDGLSQQVTGTQLDLTVVPPDLPFFKNPGYSSNPLVVLRGTEDPALAAFSDGIGEPAAWGGQGTGGGGSFAWGGGLAGLPADADLSAGHWADRIRGHGLIAAAPEAGCFSGRTAELSELVPWMQGFGWTSAGQSRPLSVVTGGPGVGKSAVLGVLVCAAHPKLREPTRSLWSLASQAPGRVPNLVAVHARQRDLADVIACLGRQLAEVLPANAPVAEPEPTDGTGPPEDAAALVAAIADATPIPVIVIDALDEAVGPQQIVDELILPLVSARRADGGPACRLLVGCRRHGFEELLDAARAQEGLVDLDETDRSTLLHDLAGYVAKLLQTQPGYRDQVPVCGTFGYAVANALTRQPDADQRWGEFLIAGLYTHSVLRETAGAPMADVAEAQRRGADCPLSLPAVLDLDLAGRPNARELRQILQIVSLARGMGMPASVIDRCRPRRPRFGPYTPTLRAVAELGFYLRRANDEDGTTLYRIFHEGLADQLRPPEDRPEDDEEILLRASVSAWEPAWSRRSAEEELVNGMLSSLGNPLGRRWDLAEPYVQRHILDHALTASGANDADAGTQSAGTGHPDLGTLLLDSEFLVHADPSLAVVLSRLDTDEAQRVRRLLTDAEGVMVAQAAKAATETASAGGQQRTTAPIDAAVLPPLSQRRAALALSAARDGNPALATALANPPPGSPEPPLRWCPRWASGQVRPETDTPGVWHADGSFWAAEGHHLSALSSGFVNGEPVIVVGTTSGQVEVRAATDGRLSARFETAGQIRAVAISEGNAVISVDADGDVRTIDLQDGRPAGPTRRLADPDVVAIETATLARHLTAAVTRADNAIVLLDLTSGNEVDWIPADEATITLADDGRIFQLLRWEDYTVMVTDSYDERHGVLAGHTGRISTLTTMSVDGRPTAVTASFDGTVRFWDVPTLREIERLDLRGPVQAAVSVGPDHLAVLCCGEVITYARRRTPGGGRV